ncbi:MAG: DinB family protein [Acidobacteriia bacterium]|nr:DinB family protein [Terriglobia bacterium]
MAADFRPRPHAKPAGRQGTIFSVNPYASFLGDRKPREVIAETSQRLASLAERLGPDGLERSLAPGKWPARAILCHLADCETVFAFRLRQALAEPHHIIQPFDQDAWATRYASLDAEAALAVFSAVRKWNLALLDAVTPEQLSKTLHHPERGDMTFQTVIETMGGHDLNHLRQLETIASQAPR